MKRIFLSITCLSLFLLFAVKPADLHAHPKAADLDTVAIATAGNAWTRKDGLTSIYFKADYPGDFRMFLRIRSAGKLTVKVSSGKQTYTKTVTNSSFEDIAIGVLKVAKAGYVKVDVEGIEKSGDNRGAISHLLLVGPDISPRVSYVKNNDDNRFYWGKRGPSVHLGYKMPADVKNDIEYFYSEVNVPEGMDPVGSYFMANGFSEGYFGIQTNSLTERRILFSIWSPFSTDDPKSIPDSLKIKLLKKGKGVYTGEFGNEGSGGQSYLVFPWKTGESHAFLTRAQADPLKKQTTYTSYFKPAGGQWMLIASFMRPNTSTGLKGLHSFLENFDPKMGDQSRRANYINQWVRDVKGNWSQVTEATFTGDDIANRGYRKDVAAGVEPQGFFLKNGGFFSDSTPLRTVLKMPVPTQKAPVIDLHNLPD